MEDALPEGVTQDGYGDAAGHIFLAAEFAADPRRHTQNAEIAGGDAMLLDVFRVIVGGEVGAAGPGTCRHVQSGDVVANGFEQCTGLRSVDIFCGRRRGPR